MTLPSTEMLLSPKLNLPKADKAKSIWQRVCTNIENSGCRKSKTKTTKSKWTGDLMNNGRSKSQWSDKSSDKSRWKPRSKGRDELHQARPCIEVVKPMCKKSKANIADPMWAIDCNNKGESKKVESTANKKKTLPARAKPKGENDRSIWAKLLANVGTPNFKRSNAGISDSGWTNDFSNVARPILAASEANKIEPKHAKPKTKAVLPRHADCCTSKVKSKWRKSKTGIGESIRQKLCNGGTESIGWNPKTGRGTSGLAEPVVLGERDNFLYQTL